MLSTDCVTLQTLLHCVYSFDYFWCSTVVKSNFTMSNLSLLWGQQTPHSLLHYSVILILAFLLVKNN